MLIDLLVYGISVALLVVWADYVMAGERIMHFESGNWIPKRDFSPSKVRATYVIKAIVIALITWSIHYFTPETKSVPLLICFYIVALALMVYLMYWWRGKTIREGIPFVLLAVIISDTLLRGSMPIMVYGYITRSLFWATVLNVLPKIVLAICIGYFIVSAFYRRYWDNLDVEDTEKANLDRILAILVAIITAIIVIVLLAFGVKTYANASDDGSKATEAPVDLADEQTEEPQYSWYGFYNLSLLQDEDPSNDYNFGPNPYVEGKDVSYYVDDFKTHISEDPALGAAVMAYFDSILGTRYMGVFYDECNEKWDAAINYAKEKFMEDQKLYYDTITAFFEFLDSAVEVKVQWGKGIEDQMYQNPYTVNGIPDVITLKTDEHEGWFLVFYYEIKGNRITVPYRINCGYQPCNVERVMDIKPLPEKPVPSVAPNTPTPKPQDPAPKSNTPTPKPKAPTNTPKPQAPTNTPTPKNLKDPTKGTKVGPNDDPGPGPDTNNGVGAQHSKDEKPTNSTFKNYDEYKESQKQLKDVNKDQKQGGDANVPAVTSKPGTKVDSNADNGTGNGGIDKKTPTQGAIHVVAPDGTTHENSSGNGTAWGGPVD